ncbi:hypothetical protein H0H92_006336 [Tricholoma furcatifolium]|nr:hypothetical protein H0H92_006336 [Tricholoma furcatifolium]
MSVQVPTLGGPDRGGERPEQERHQTMVPSDNDVLVLQVRAFLEASEDVDIDVETVEDLMQSLPADFDTETELDPVGENESISEDEDEDEDHSLNEDARGDRRDATEGVDSGLFAPPEEEDEQVWTPQEVKEMMHHLKERGMASWIKEYVLNQNLPIPKLLHAFGISLCKPLQSKKPTTLLYFLKVALSRELRIRDKLTQYNTISDAVKLISSSRRILILTGAGISVSCGIPDFRSRDGLYASLKDRGQYDLEDPQQMFDINYFRENPAGK